MTSGSTIKMIQSLKSDFEQLRATTQAFTLKKDTDLIENRLLGLTPINKFYELQRRCDDYALAVDMSKTMESLTKLEKSLSSYCLSMEVNNKLEDISTKVDQQLDMKINKEVFLQRVLSVEESVTIHSLRT